MCKFTYQCALNYTDIKLQTSQDKVLILMLKNIIRGGLSGVMGDLYVKSDETIKIFYMDATTLYGHSMSQPLPFDEIEMWHGHPDYYMNKLEENLYTPDDNDVEHFIEVDLKYLDNIKEKTKSFPFCPDNKIIDKSK